MQITLTQAELEQRIKKMSREMRYLEDFVQGVSHDLNGALLVLKGQLMLMDKYRTSAEKQVALNEIKGAGERMSSILETMSELASYQCGVNQEVKVCNLENIWTRVKFQLYDKIQVADPLWNIDFSAAPGIKFYPPYINTILYNFLSNALKYRKKKERLTITVQSFSEGPYLGIAFQDNGIGMDLDQYGHLLFEPFQRICYDRPGKGVGLSFVHKVIRDTGGHIEVKSEQGIGSRFTVFLKPLSTIGAQESKELLQS